jgi:hypothetical protein
MPFGEGLFLVEGVSSTTDPELSSWEFPCGMSNQMSRDTGSVVNKRPVCVFSSPDPPTHPLPPGP